jgi:hypothetical protein
MPGILQNLAPYDDKTRNTEKESFNTFILGVKPLPINALAKVWLY